jgi:hypothetical protein
MATGTIKSPLQIFLSWLVMVSDHLCFSIYSLQGKWLWKNIVLILLPKNVVRKNNGGYVFFGQTYRTFQCCGSGMFIPDPDPTIFWYPRSGFDCLLSRIPIWIPDPDPTNKRREKLTYLFHAGKDHN